MKSNRESKQNNDTAADASASDASEFFDALKKGALIGLGILVVVLPLMHYGKRPVQQPPAQPQVAQGPVAPAPAQPPVAAAPSSPAAPVPAPAPAVTPPEPERKLADFGGQSATDDVKLVANWATWTHDYKKNAFVILDKKDAQVYVFGPDGKLKGTTPVLLGRAKGDHTVKGIGDKPLSQVKESEKTTPAGRFKAEPGRNLSGEDVIWVDYDAAVSMHRIRKVAEKERRFQRLATATKADNRISFGCINIPVAFYNDVLSPTVKKHGAIVYVLPEVWTIQKAIGAYDVTKELARDASKDVTNPTQVAQRT